MPLIDWKPEFAVGVPDVDHEHRLMIDMINDVAAMLDEGGIGPGVGGVLGEIHARITAHFAPTLAARLEAWFGVHFRTEDARLHRMPALLRSRGAWRADR